MQFFKKTCEPNLQINCNQPNFGPDFALFGPYLGLRVFVGFFGGGGGGGLGGGEGCLARLAVRHCSQLSFYAI